MKSVVRAGAPWLGLRAALLAGVFALGACATHESKIARFDEAWDRADFKAADAEVDHLIASEAGVPEKLVTESRGLAEEIAPAKGDTFLYLLEKSLTRLAQDDVGGCIDLLRHARDVLTDRYNDKDAAGFVKSALGDDAMREYTGADYEHVLVPTVLALAALLEGGQDSYAYALQVNEAQERILGSTFGDDVDGKGNGYNPRKSYQRVPIGAYLEGVVRERESYTSEAFKAYERAREWGGGEVAVDACKRTSEGTYSEPGKGVVHVFYFAGRGPRLVQGTSPVAGMALTLVNIGAWVNGGGVATLGQKDVPVPVVRISDPSVAPLSIATSGITASTSLLLDVNAVAQQQLDANMPWIVARAAVRRIAKAVAAKAAQDAVDRHNKDSGFGILAGVLTNFALTAGERADTRSWTSLPAQIQAARILLPEGANEILLDGRMRVGVRVAAGKDSYVVVVRPDVTRDGAVLVDAYSRVQPAQPAQPAKP